MYLVTQKEVPVMSLVREIQATLVDPKSEMSSILLKLRLLVSGSVKNPARRGGILHFWLGFGRF